MEDILQIFKNTQNTVLAVKLSSLSTNYKKPKYCIIMISWQGQALRPVFFKFSLGPTLSIIYL